MAAASGSLLGVDGGNSKTLALVARPDGTVVGAGRTARSSDLHAEPEAAVLATLDAVVGEAVRSAGRSRLAHTTFSLAGADWPEDIDWLTVHLRDRWPGTTVVNDAIGALRAAIPLGAGVVIVCGTGTATGARGPDGRTWHSGFWQGPHAARELGLMALRAVYRAELGLDPGTALTGALLAATGAPDVEAVLHARTARDGGAEDPARFAAILLDAADAGDQIAADLVHRHGLDLGQVAVAAGRRVGIADDAPATLALAGGLFRHPARRLRRSILEAVGDLAPGYRLGGTGLEPAVGALLLSFDRAGIEIDAAVQARLIASLPDPSFFAGGAGTGSA
ncbi:MAG TPA: BadF/BadG/BcrA/BcrD ATPase family protein [Candidatus Saccharimonadales bacterium]|nr:BadF/BadG/BcrA/BcrD ATPase family protein [Candidatus Saccharimonadales bacterium]